MTTSRDVVRNRHGLVVLAILLLLLAGVVLYFGSHNYLIRDMVLVAIMASVYLARISRVHERSGLPEASGRGKGPGPLLWIVSLALVPLLAASAFLQHIDAANGGHEAWPVDVFAGVVLACAGVWGCLAAKIYSGGTG